MAEQLARVEVWSDYVCPFCCLEEPVLERLQQKAPGSARYTPWRHSGAGRSACPPCSRAALATESHETP